MVAELQPSDPPLKLAVGGVQVELGASRSESCIFQRSCPHPYWSCLQHSIRGLQQNVRC